MTLIVLSVLSVFLSSESSDSSSSLEQEKYLRAILNSIPVYFKMNGNNTLSNRSLIGLSPGTEFCSASQFTFVL